MFGKKRIKELEKLIQTQNEIIERQAIFMPTFERLNAALNKYEQGLYIAVENEANYIHAALKTAIGMIMKSRTEIIQKVQAEMAKLSEFYIENILQEAKTCEDSTTPTEQ